jgi:hypothetical protein
MNDWFCILEYNTMYSVDTRPLSFCFLIWLSLQPRRWRRHVPPKLQSTFTGLHGIMSQRIGIFHGYHFENLKSPTVCTRLEFLSGFHGDFTQIFSIISFEGAKETEETFLAAICFFSFWKHCFSAVEHKWQWCGGSRYMVNSLSCKILSALWVGFVCKISHFAGVHVFVNSKIDAVY